MCLKKLHLNLLISTKNYIHNVRLYPDLMLFVNSDVTNFNFSGLCHIFRNLKLLILLYVMVFQKIYLVFLFFKYFIITTLCFPEKFTLKDS